MNAQQGARVRAAERVVRSRTGDPVSAHPAPSGSEWPPPSPIQPSLSSLTPAHADPFPLWSFLLSSFHTQNLPPPNPSPSDPSPSDPSPLISFPLRSFPPQILSRLMPFPPMPFPFRSFPLRSFPFRPCPSDPSPSDPSPSDPSELSPSEPARLRSFPTLIIPLSDPSLSGLSTPLRFFHPQVFPPETLPLHILPASEPSTQIIPPSGPCLSEPFPSHPSTFRFFPRRKLPPSNLFALGSFPLRSFHSQILRP